MRGTTRAHLRRVREQRLRIATVATIAALPLVITGKTPALIQRSDGAGNFVYVLDLGVVAPLALMTAGGVAMSIWFLSERRALSNTVTDP